MAEEEKLTPRERAARQILMQADWDREEGAGRLTAEQVAERLWRMAMHEFADPDEPAAAAFDEDGFFQSLTAASVAVVDGIKIDLATGAERQPLPPNVRSKQLKNIKALVAKHHEALCDTWTSYHGTKVETADLHTDV